jgi:pterin-4a-carbinolamine dehydratase
MTTYNEQSAGPILAELPGWSFKEAGIEKSFQFTDFVAAFGFMTPGCHLCRKSQSSS